MTRDVKLVGPLVVWTLFVWVSRLRNIWTDESLSAGGQAVRTVVAAVFIGFAVATAALLWRGRGTEEGMTGTGRGVLGAFVVWTIGFWLVRGVGIILDDHTASFTAIHTVLMIVSIAIALLAGRTLRVRDSISSSPVPAR